MSYQIFICYRRDGGESLAALLYERFMQRGYRVFYDVESLRSGEFNEKLLTVIEECDDVLIVLPPHGLDRCIEYPKDWVRQEIEHALALKKNVIPLMMRNFVFPDNLPESMKELPNLNGISANMEFFDAVIDRIADRRLISRPDMESDTEELHTADLIRRADAGDAAACNELGMLYEQGSVTMVQNLRTAYAYYTRGMELGSMAAACNLGEMYETCAEDLSLAAEYGIDLSGIRTAEEGSRMLLERSEQCYAAAAEQAYAPALYRMGIRMEEKLDPEKAFDCYSRAADQNYYPALNAVAWMYRNGRGVRRDPRRAEELYRRAAEAGYPPALYNYAGMIERRDPEAALSLYTKVAYGDDAIPEAAYVLGRRYEYSMHDMRNAIECYERALAGGITQAAEDLARCRRTWY